MKASIITLHYINHYGSLLQTYATCYMFNKLGIETEIIDYQRPNASEKQQILDALHVRGISINSIRGMIYATVKRIENYKRHKFSEDFKRKYITFTRHYVNYDDLCSDPPAADVYCTGSDQTWNSIYNGGLLPAYYLRFAPNGKKRIGYAVSIGMEKYPENERKLAAEYIKDYAAVSVRESSALDIIRDLGYNNVSQIVDPTLAMSKEEWSPLIARRKIKEKYIIIYKLNSIPEIEEFADILARKTGCKIVRMSYYLNHFKYQGKMVYSPSVEEFLSLINYAEYVITDSFHCLAFSLNFQKEFYAFFPDEYNSRLKSLMELTGTLSRRVNDVNYYNTDPINYDYVNKTLERERKRSEAFIRQNCEI